MHELSIAEGMAELVRRYVPPGERVLRVYMQAGPLRAIDPDTMQIAWRAISADNDLSGSELELTISQWQLKCESCGRQWQGPSMTTLCECGEAPFFTESDELLLTAIDVDDEAGH